MSASRALAERASLAELRQVVARIEGHAQLVAAAETAGEEAWRFGVAAVDRAIGGQLAPALHAVRAAEVGDVPAAHGFALAMAARSGRRRGLLWVATALHVREWGLPYAPGLARYGCDASELLVVEARRAGDAGWALEEALRSGAFAFLVGAGLAVDFTASRRLALAAAERTTPCLLVDAPGRADASAASTIWRIAARLSAADEFDVEAPGHPRWRAELIRSRGSAPAGPWELDWDEQTHRFALAAAPADRAAAPEARPGVPAGPSADCGAVRAERGRAARA